MSDQKNVTRKLKGGYCKTKGRVEGEGERVSKWVTETGYNQNIFLELYPPNVNEGLPRGREVMRG